MVYAYNELGTAQRFEHDPNLQGKFTWTKSTDWMTYTPSGKWTRDNQGNAVRAMIYVIENLALEGDEDAAKWSFRAGCNKHINGSLAVASKLDTIAKSINQFDSHKHLFNCKNGTYDLNTGEFREHRPEDYLTKSCGIDYDASATCPQFEKFLLEVMAGKEEMRQFLQRAVGYTMSAYTHETAMFIPHGTGGTGKSQFLAVLTGIMGDYATWADPDMFIAKHGDAGQPFDMAGKDGVRGLFASETREGKRLDQAKVKQMTGGDPVRACYKGKDAYLFVPQWKIWYAANDRPVVTAEDAAMWDRLKLIPFDVVFRDKPGQVKDLAVKLLREEASGILNWCLKGYAMWQERGLDYPKEVTEATAEWRENEDYLQRFLDEFTVPTEEKMEFVKKSDMFKKFADWAKDSKEGRGLTDKAFSTNMERKGYRWEIVRKGLATARCWEGIRLVDSMEKFGERMLADAGFDPFDAEPAKPKANKPN